jgi:hypothetical protein
MNATVVYMVRHGDSPRSGGNERERSLSAPIHQRDHYVSYIMQSLARL